MNTKSRPVPIAAALATARLRHDEVDDEDDDEPLTEVLGRAMPSWLASLVFHLALVLLLALLTTVGTAGQGHNITLEFQSGGGSGGNEGAMEDSMGLAGELPSTEMVVAEAEQANVPVDLTQVAPEMPVMPLGDLALRSPEQINAALGGAGAGSGGGSGGGDGGGNGAGEGDGDGNGLGIATTGLFGLVTEGRTFVYVFDRSESMNSQLVFTSEGREVGSVTPLAAAKKELIKSLDDLNSKQRFHVLFYNHEMWSFDKGPGRGRPMVASDANKLRAKTFVQSVYAHGNTHHVKPLEVAVRMQPDVIFLLTDGEEKDDPTLEQIARLTRQNGGVSKINVIQFVWEPRTKSTLIQLANENGGRHVFLNINRLAPNINELVP